MNYQLLRSINYSLSTHADFVSRQRLTYFSTAINEVIGVPATLHTTDRSYILTADISMIYNICTTWIMFCPNESVWHGSCVPICLRRMSMMRLFYNVSQRQKYRIWMIHSRSWSVWFVWCAQRIERWPYNLIDVWKKLITHMFDGEICTGLAQYLTTANII